MKSKNINRVKPYCYILTRLSDGMRYHGLRWDNIRYNRTPKEDFGIFYFTSRASLKKEFKNNKDNFKFKITYTFDSKKEAQEYEKKFNKRIIKDKKWLNQSAYPHLIQSEEGKERIRQSRIGKKLSKETIKKIIESGTGLKRSKKTKIKMSKAQRSLNKKLSLKTKKKISDKKKSLYRTGVLVPYNKGTKLSSKIRKKISRSLKGTRKGKKNPFYGKKHSKETLAKIAKKKAKYKNKPTKKMIEGRKKQAKKMKGRHYQTEDSKKKISLTHLGNKYNVGRIVSQKTREKISKSNKGKKISSKARKKISESLKKYFASK
jgi:hypothetical protein